MLNEEKQPSIPFFKIKCKRHKINVINQILYSPLTNIKKRRDKNGEESDNCWYDSL